MNEKRRYEIAEKLGEICDMLQMARCALTGESGIIDDHVEDGIRWIFETQDKLESLTLELP